MAFGVETAGLKSITLQAALPDTTHQMVGDVAVAGRGEDTSPYGHRYPANSSTAGIA